MLKEFRRLATVEMPIDSTHNLLLFDDEHVHFHYKTFAVDSSKSALATNIVKVAYNKNLT